MVRRIRLVLLAAVTVVLAGCASPVEIQAGQYAPAPDCGRVLVATPDSLVGAERRETTSQATTAWGDNPAVTLRCGVEVPGPSTDRCVTVETPSGPSVDWVSLQEGEPSGGSGAWTFVTYGRDPAVEVVVPVEQVGDGQVTSFLTELGSSVALVEADRTCVGPEDVD